jgi:hypothetical protein
LLESLPARQRAEFIEWLREGRHASLIPAWAMDAERELFISDFRFVVELIDN